MRAKKRSKFGKSWLEEGTWKDFMPQGSAGLEAVLENPIDDRPIPYIAGVTGTGTDVDRLLYRAWLMKSPQARFADSALGDMIGASVLGDPGGSKGFETWAKRNDYWGGLAKNVVGGGAVPMAHLSDVIGVEGEGLRVEPSYVEKQNTYTGMKGDTPPPQQTQATPSWSQMSRSDQVRIAKYAEEHGISIEDALQTLGVGRYSGSRR